MKRIILMMISVLLLTLCNGQPRTSGGTNMQRQSPPQRQTQVSRPSAPSRSTYTPSRPNTVQTRPNASTTRPSTTPVTRPSQNVPVNRPSTSNVQRTVPVTRTTTPQRPPQGSGNVNHTRTVVPNGNHVVDDKRPHGDPYSVPPRPQGGNPHGGHAPHLDHHPYEHCYHHPHMHHDIHMHRVYWNPYCPSLLLDGFWIYSHTYYHTEYYNRYVYVTDFNSTRYVEIIDYVIDDTYTYCIQKEGWCKYFRVYNSSNKLIAQYELGNRYEKLIYDNVSNGVWCMKDNGKNNLLFIIDEYGRLICYQE